MVDDRLWELTALLIPPRPTPGGPSGRPRIEDRAASEEILFVLHTGGRRDLTAALGRGSGHTVRRRLRHCQEAGVRKKPHRAVLEALPEAEMPGWSRAGIDAVPVRADRAGAICTRSIPPATSNSS